MSKPVTTTTTTTTTNTTTPTTPPKPTTPVTPAQPQNSTMAPPASASGSTAQGDWFGSLWGFFWTYLWTVLYASFIVWWWTPISAILFGNWTDFYTFFVGNSASFGG